MMVQSPHNKTAGSHASAWEPVLKTPAFRDAGASALHSHAGASERENPLKGERLLLQYLSE